MAFLFSGDLSLFIKTAGYIGIFIVLFAESGILLGFFLPGDSLLFTAGFLASQGYFSIILLMVLAWAAAVVGDSVGYMIGEKVGPRLFTRKKTFFFDPKYVEYTKDFFERHGGKTIVLARFTPFVRTLAPLLAGVGKMPYQNFFFYNILGGALWGLGIPLLGFVLGSVIPDVDHYLLPIIGLVILVSLLPGIIHLLIYKFRR